MLATLCARLEAILVGQAAERLLTSGEPLPASGGLWVPPAWTWLFARVDVGRKDRAPDGTRLRLPVRLAWSEDQVAIVVPGQPRTFGWSAAGLGHSGNDSVHVTTAANTGGNPGAALGPDAGGRSGVIHRRVESGVAGVPKFAILQSRSDQELEARLTEYVHQGATARWQLLLWLEPYVQSALRRAHASVSRELATRWGSRRVLVDDTKLTAIADRMLLGDADHPGKVSQLLDRCLMPDTFRRVEPVKYIKDALRRDANAEIRRALGDPHVGAKVRKVADDLGTGEVDAVVKEYRRRYPNDRLSHGRATAALSVAPDPMASWWELHPGDRTGGRAAA